jgi:hypothetical protein
MNIVDSEVPLVMVAKTCGCNDSKAKKVTYIFVDSYYTLCIDKKDILLAELAACERYLKGGILNEDEKSTIETEISELKMALDLIH